MKTYMLTPLIGCVVGVLFPFVLGWILVQAEQIDGHTFGMGYVLFWGILGSPLNALGGWLLGLAVGAVIGASRKAHRRRAGRGAAAPTTGQDQGGDADGDR